MPKFSSAIGAENRGPDIRLRHQHGPLLEVKRYSHLPGYFECPEAK